MNMEVSGGAVWGAEGEVITIEVAPSAEPGWHFICDSEDAAQRWQKVLPNALHSLTRCYVTASSPKNCTLTSPLTVRLTTIKRAPDDGKDFR